MTFHMVALHRASVCSYLSVTEFHVVEITVSKFLWKFRCLLGWELPPHKMEYVLYACSPQSHASLM
uniref:Putative ovule protein n=1 Tax=Solanum chacoense TaxID=4108 RepID=A0A0V0GSA4_SOLCH